MKTLNWTGARRRIARLLVFVWVLSLMGMAKDACAVPSLSTADPNCFFTTVASRLLASQMGVNLSAIQIYPTNEYTPAVHRLLQVTANIYDCTTTNYYPSVFRPLFWKTNELVDGVPQTNIYVAGYQYVQEPLTNNTPIFTLPVDACDPSVPFGLSGMTNNIYGIPWILGVKKGLPNFNALEMENVFSIERQLQFNRNSAAAAPPEEPFPYGRAYTTNQMYMMSISNYLGVEFWNSYTGTYTGPLTLVANDTLSMELTNDAGGTQPVPPLNEYPQSVLLQSFTNVIAWPGLFSVPLITTTTWLTNSVYFYGPGFVTLGFQTFSGPGFIPLAYDPSNFLDVGTPPLPNFGLTITNRLQAYIIDANDCILDYVQLNGMDSSINLSEAVADNTYAAYAPGNSGVYSRGLWSTNYFAGNIPYGVYEQFLVSAGASTIPEPPDGDGGFWASTPVPGTSDIAPAAQVAFFAAFFTPDNFAYDGPDGLIVTNMGLSILAPYTPIRKVVQHIVYAANDPLVHYMTSDLQDFVDDTNSLVMDNPPLSGLFTYNRRYMPWGTKGNMPAVLFYDNNAYNLAYKDPQVKSSDYWNFPTNETLNASWLGQVHRGTPWQTIFLKSTNILALTLSIPGVTTIPTGLDTWQIWTGDTNADAAAMAPVADWHMVSFLASLFETNYASLISVNDGNPNDWEGLLNGMTVLTNDVKDISIQNGFFPPQFAMLTVSSNSSQAAAIANGIIAAHSTNGPWFTNLGDVFATPSLSDASPYLNVDAAQIQYGINDEAYEAIPSQLLPLLRMDSIGSIVPASGQEVIQFSGDDNHAYAVQVSSDLLHWTSLSTNCPVGGSFSVTNTGTAGRQFYRTVLVQ